MFCPKCREHWQILTSTAGKKEPSPFTCPACGVPLAADRIAAEFPALDASRRMSGQTLTVGEFLRETSVDAYQIDHDDLEARVLVQDNRRGGWLSDVRARLSRLAHQDGFSAIVSIIVTVVILMIVCSLNLNDSSNLTASPKLAPVPAISTSSILPEKVGDWTRWPQLTDYKDSSDGHELVTTTYERGQAHAEVWLQGMPSAQDGGKAAWARFVSAAPVVQGPTVGATLQAREQVINSVRCRIWTIPGQRLAATRIVPSSWLPSSQPVMISWQNSGYVETVAGSEPTALAFARVLVGTKKS